MCVCLLIPGDIKCTSTNDAVKWSYLIWFLFSLFDLVLLSCGKGISAFFYNSCFSLWLNRVVCSFSYQSAEVACLELGVFTNLESNSEILKCAFDDDF